MSIIFGLNCMAHDTSVCVLRDGKLEIFLEEERLNRDKHTSKYPRTSIESALKITNINPENVDFVAYGHQLQNHTIDLESSQHFSEEQQSEILWDFELRNKANLWRKYFGSKTKLVHVPHHNAHAASAFLASPFDEAVVLSIDGSGNNISTQLALGKGNTIQTLGQIDYPHSLGRLWAVITSLLGFHTPGDEGKVMALASYGDPGRFAPEFDKLITITKSGFFKLNLEYFGHYHEVTTKLYNLFFKKDEANTLHLSLQKYKDIAATLQYITEKTFVGLVNWLIEKSGCQSVCLAGGVALNCVANERIISETTAKNLFVQPASGDAGTALGAALSVYYEQTNSVRSWRMEHAYWGKDIVESDVRYLLDKAKIPAEKLESPAQVAAKLLAQGRIIGWVQGRSEVGPRSLGNRSILCDPRTKEMKDYLNSIVKGREDFRPFAPITLRTKASQYFELQDGNYAYDFMLSACLVKEKYRSIIPSVVHVDNTARLQITDESKNPILSQLLEEFGAITNVYVLLNTSFNLAGEPIVDSPRDAIRTFYSCGLDDLFIGNYWISKHPKTEL